MGPGNMMRQVTLCSIVYTRSVWPSTRRPHIYLSCHAILSTHTSNGHSRSCNPSTNSLILVHCPPPDSRSIVSCSFINIPFLHTETVIMRDFIRIQMIKEILFQARVIFKISIFISMLFYEGAMKWWVRETHFYENYLFFTFLFSIVSVNLHHICQ